MVELGLPLAMQISITVDLISKKISLYAELTTVETISPVAPSQSENLVHRVTRCKLRPLSIFFFLNTTPDDMDEIDDKDTVVQSPCCENIMFPKQEKLRYFNNIYTVMSIQFQIRILSKSGESWFGHTKYYFECLMMMISSFVRWYGLMFGLNVSLSTGKMYIRSTSSFDPQKLKPVKWLRTG